MANSSLRIKQEGYGTIASIIGLVFGIIISILALRFVFRLFGANPESGLVAWIYSASAPLLAPFFGIFNYEVNLATGTFEMITLIAIAVYGFVAWLLQSMTSFGGRRHPV